MKNIRRYTLTVLYNAPTTINQFYDAEVRHDMYYWGRIFRTGKNLVSTGHEVGTVTTVSGEIL